MRGRTHCIVVTLGDVKCPLLQIRACLRWPTNVAAFMSSRVQSRWMRRSEFLL